MWLRVCLRASFCQESFKSSFQIRSKLSEFFKHTHPDTNHNAPETIKEQNLRSLKNLNAYIDSLLQAKPIEAKLLKFYVSEKSNQKSKKYYAFEVELPTVQSSTTSENNNVILNNVIDILNSKFLETRMIKNPLLKKQLHKQQGDRQPIKLETEEERRLRHESELKPFRKNRQRFTEQFQNLMNEKIKQSQVNIGRESLLGELQKKVLLANTPANKPLLWSRIALKKAGLYTNYQQMLSKIIDPKLIYFGQNLSQPQIDQFKQTLLPGEQTMTLQLTEEHQKMHKIFLQMEDSSPPIFLLVTHHYSPRDIPGFFSVPYNFKPADFVYNYRLHIRQINEQRLKYEEYYDAVKGLVESLKTENKLSVELGEFKNNSDIARKYLMVKRLSHHRAEVDTLVVPFDEIDYRYFCEEYGVDSGVSCHVMGSKVVMMIEFSDVDLKRALGVE